MPRFAIHCVNRETGAPYVTHFQAEYLADAMNVASQTHFVDISKTRTENPTATAEPLESPDEISARQMVTVLRLLRHPEARHAAATLICKGIWYYTLTLALVVFLIRMFFAFLEMADKR